MKFPEITVSVRLMVYNNENYIRKTLEGILLQKVDFKVEVVVGDDFSTDKTLSIIRSYKDTDKIHFKILDRPVGGAYWKKRKSKDASVRTNFMDIIQNCSGKYIALLDGDDYWIDPLKLQKQVDFLEANPEFIICFHETKVLWENTTSKNSKRIKLNSDFPWNYMNPQKDIYTIKDVLMGPFMATNSVVFRNNILPEFPNWFNKVRSGDMALYSMITKDYKIKFLNESMSVYRKHYHGVSGNHRGNPIIINRLYLLHYINKYHNNKYLEYIKDAVSNYLINLKHVFIKDFFKILQLYFYGNIITLQQLHWSFNKTLNWYLKK